MIKKNRHPPHENKQLSGCLETLEYNGPTGAAWKEVHAILQLVSLNANHVVILKCCTIL